MFFAIVTVGIYMAPFDVLSRLSLWQYLHIPSPSIGLTRSYWLILHGQYIQAWHFNPLIYAVLLIGMPMLAFDAIKVYQHRKNRPIQSH